MATQTQYNNALASSGGNVNSPMFQEWLAKYGGNNGVAAVQYGDLANNVNQFMGNQAQMQYVNNLPNYAGMVGKRSDNILSELSGQVPQDVINQISQQAAERGIAGGSGASPNSGAAYLRALGLTSMQLQQQGSQNLTAAINDTPVAEIWNPMSLYVPEKLAAQEQAAAKAGIAAGSAPKNVTWKQKTANTGPFWNSHTVFG